MYVRMRGFKLETVEGAHDDISEKVRETLRRAVGPLTTLAVVRNPGSLMTDSQRRVRIEGTPKKGGLNARLFEAYAGLPTG